MLLPTGFRVVCICLDVRKGWGGEERHVQTNNHCCVLLHENNKNPVRLLFSWYATHVIRTISQGVFTVKFGFTTASVVQQICCVFSMSQYQRTSAVKLTRYLRCLPSLASVVNDIATMQMYCVLSRLVNLQKGGKVKYPFLFSRSFVVCVKGKKGMCIKHFNTQSQIFVQTGYFFK